MRPLFNSQNTLPKFPIIQSEQDADAQLETAPRETFMGKELPTADQPLGMTSQKYCELIEHALRKRPEESPDPYYQYMHLGLYPPGPYDDSPEGKINTDRMTSLIQSLVQNRQFTALNELIERCEPLAVLPVDLSSLPPEQLTKFLANVSTYHPELPALKISARRSAQAPEEIDRKVSLLKDFISRSTHLKAFTFGLVSTELSLAVINAIARANHLESLELDYKVSLSDDACDKLKEIIRNSPQLRCIGLSNHNRSEESLLEFLLTLRACAQLEILTLENWGCRSEESVTQLSELIGKSTQLKQLSLAGLGIPETNGQLTALRAISTGLSENRSLNSVSLKWESERFIDPDLLFRVIQAAKHHPCLKQLALDRRSTYQLPVIQALAELAETNKGIIDVGIRPVDLNQYQKQLTRRQKMLEDDRALGNTGEPQEKIKKTIAELNRIAGLIEEKLARNKALASGDMARIFSQAFFASPGALPGTNHIGDPGLLLTEHILSLSPNMPHFQTSMVEVALTVDETAKLEQEKESAPGETTNDQTIELRSTTNNDAKPDSRS